MIDELMGLNPIDQATESPVVAELLPSDYPLLDLTAVGWPIEGGPGPFTPYLPIYPVMPAPVILPPPPPMTPTAPVTPVVPLPLPEPGSWAMMVLGFGLLGASARFRRIAKAGSKMRS